MGAHGSDVHATGSSAGEEHRPFEEPGMWQAMLGTALAVLAPLAGFLGGTMAGGAEPEGNIDTLLTWLIVGLVIGGVGALIAFHGWLRWHRNIRAHRPSD